MIESLQGSLDTTFEIRALGELANDLDRHPGLLEVEAELRASQARIEQARAERIPDVKVELLYHRLEATNEDTIDLGLNIPLPLFNRNRGRLLEASAEADVAAARARLSRNALAAEIRRGHRQLTDALARVDLFKTEIMPRAETVVQSAANRYEAGEISLAELLPVRRGWAEARLLELESIRVAMLAWVEISSLTSGS
jgi:cobalt-zinc-cadmium efflux system outer membrane protein